MVDEATFTLDRSVRNQIRHNPMRLVAVLVRTDVGTARLDRNMGEMVVTLSSGQCCQAKLQPASVFQDRLGGIAPWQSPRSIRPANIIIRPPLITTLPRIIIIKPPTIMILASTKRRRSTPTRLTSMASKDTSTPRPPTNIRISDAHRRRRRCRLLLLAPRLRKAILRKRGAKGRLLVDASGSVSCSSIAVLYVA
jgi:hypothetical protein